MRSIVLLAVLFVGCTFGKIEPGHVGVVVPLSGNDKGTIETTSNGWYLYSFNTNVYEFPVYNQQYNWRSIKDGSQERMYFGDRNGLRLGADVGIQFHVPAGQVTTLFKTYRQDLEHIRDTIIKMSVQNSLNLTAQGYTAEDVFGDKRGEFFQKVFDRVKSELAPNGLDIVSIYLNGELELPEAIRNTIQAKLQATMSAQQKENEKRTVEAEAAKQVAQAEGEAKSSVATAEGAARAAIARAEGEAKANVARTEGEAQAQVIAAKARADSRILEADAEAKSNQKIAQSLTGAILELKKLQINADIQMSYANKWQGGVPTTVLPAQANGFLMDMRGMNLGAK